MEFHGTARVIEIGALQVPWNSMQFHGTPSVSEIGAHQIPWDSMELLVSAKLTRSKFHGIPWNLFLLNGTIYTINYRIPWNLSFPILLTIIFNLVGWINFRTLISTLYLIVYLFHQLMFYHQYLHYTKCIPGITHYVSKYHSKLLFNAHWNLFW